MEVTVEKLQKVVHPYEVPTKSETQPRIVDAHLPMPEVPDVSFSQYAYEHLKKHGDKVYIIDGDTGATYTFNDVANLSRRVASAVLRKKLEPGEVCCIYSCNCPEFLLAFLGLVAAGCVPVLLNPNLTPDEVCQHLKDSGAVYMFTSEDNLFKAQEGAKSIPDIREICTFGNEQIEGCVCFSDFLNDDGSQLTQLTPVDTRETTLAMFCSSGTTGLPKCVQLTHYGVVANLVQSRSHKDMRMYSKGDVILCVLPLAHAYASLALAVPCFIDGATIVIMRRYRFEDALIAIDKYKITTFPLVPPIALRLLQDPAVNNYDLSSLTTVISAAAPLSGDIEEVLKQKLRISTFRQLYGMTELSPLVAVVPVNRPRPGSTGVLYPGSQMKIADLDTNETLGPMERGEIWIRGPHVMKGYLNNPDATKEIMDDDGWLHTGDIGYFDDDNFIYIVDRRKEIIRFKCTQVAPAEIEALLLKLEGVLDAAVIGIPDVMAGELPRAYVVRRLECGLTEARVQKHVADNAASFKHLRGGVEFVDVIPKSSTGKILRRILRQKYIDEMNYLKSN